MTKTYKIVFWFATLFLSFGMLAGGIQQMLQIGGYVDIARQLGYPVYFLSIIGVWKILGVIVLLIPKTPLLKEWTYAGFFFVMSGAAASHIAIGHPLVEVIPSLVLLIFIIVSWYFRPADRKLTTTVIQ